MTDKDIVCMWKSGTDCGGSVSKQLIFAGQIQIEICDGHMEEYRETLTSYANTNDLKIEL